MEAPSTWRLEEASGPVAQSGQSIGLLIRVSWVRIPAGSPTVSETYGDSNSASRVAVCGQYVSHAGYWVRLISIVVISVVQELKASSCATTVITWTLFLSSSNGFSKSGNLFRVSIR